MQFPALVYPAFKLQLNMQENTLGKAFWNGLKHKNFVKSQAYYAHAALKNAQDYKRLEKVPGSH